MTDEMRLGWIGDHKISERFYVTLEATMFLSSCACCQHKNLTGPTCNAFPDGIPAAILDGEHSHRSPFPGDNGIQFEAVEGDCVESLAPHLREA